MAFEIQVTYDCADPGALAQFWAETLGYTIQPPPEGFDSWDSALEAWGVPPEHRNDRSALVDPDGSGPRLFFQKVPEGKSAKNRVHLDVRAAPDAKDSAERMATLEAKAERLIGLGASRTRQVDPAPPTELGFIVMADPEGNEFCLD